MASMPPRSGTPVPTEELKMLREGQMFLRHTLQQATKEGALPTLVSKPILLWFDDSAAVPAPGTLYFTTLPGAKLPPGEGQLSMAALSTMAAGKESALFRSIAARSLAADKCLSVSGSRGGVTLDLEAPNMELREKWFKALDSVMVRHGRTRKAAAAAAAANVSASPASPPQGHRTSVSLGSAPVGQATPSSSPSPSPSPVPVSVQSPTPSPASAAASSPSPSPLISAVVVPPTPTVDEPLSNLQCGLPLTVFYTTPGPKVETLTAEILLFLVIAPAPLPPGASQPAASTPLALSQLNLLSCGLHWCAAASFQRKVVDGQRLALASVREMKEGNAASIYRAPVAAKADPACCFQIVSGGLTLSLCAPSEVAKKAFMADLHWLILSVQAAKLAVASAAAGGAAVAGAGATPGRQRGSVSVGGTPSSGENLLRRAESDGAQQSALEAGRPSSLQHASMGSTASSTSTASTSSSVLSPHPNPLSPNSPASPAPVSYTHL